MKPCRPWSWILGLKDSFCNHNETIGTEAYNLLLSFNTWYKKFNRVFHTCALPLGQPECVAKAYITNFGIFIFINTHAECTHDLFSGVRVSMETTPLLLNKFAGKIHLVADNGDYLPAKGFRQWMSVFWLETLNLWMIGFPITVTMICQFGISSVTDIFVGHLGVIELSAVTIATSVIGNFSFSFLVSIFRSSSLFEIINW